MTLLLTPFIMLDGNAKEAIEFYEQSLDAKVLSKQTFGEMPQNPEFPLPEDVKERVTHSLLKVGESELMIADIFPGQPHQKGSQVSICITTNDAEASKRIYEALQQDGQVNMPLQETFFSPAFGVVQDKFGVTFQIYTESKK